MLLLIYRKNIFFIFYISISKLSKNKKKSYKAKNIHLKKKNHGVAGKTKGL